MWIDDEGVCHEGVFFRTPYNYNMAAASVKSGLECKDVTRAQQQFAEECDINTIVRRFGLTGELPKDVVAPMQGDFTEVVDYKTALDMVRAADEAFMKMPAEVRTRFNNDPQRFLEFTSDDRNRDEARKLGLLRPIDPPAKPLEVRVIPDAPSAGTVST